MNSLTAQPLRNILHPATLFIAVSVLCASGIAWAFMVLSMRKMSAMGAMMDNRSALAAVTSMSPMWIAMIIAMMLPVAVASIIGSCRTASGRLIPLGGVSFTVGYLLSCVAFGLIAAGLSGIIHPKAWSSGFTVGLLFVGTYQWMPVKLRALATCRGDLFRGRMQSSGEPARDFGNGLTHAAGCFKCCGIAMLAPLFTGMTSISFMVLLFFWMVLEQAGWLSAIATRAIGAGWMAAGAFVLLKSFHFAAV